MMEWNNDTLQHATVLLEASDSVREAVEELSGYYDEDISVDALGKAFKRHGLLNPSHYLGEGRGMRSEWDAKIIHMDGIHEDEDPEGYYGAKEDEEECIFDYKIDFEESEYRFHYGEAHRLTFDDMEQLCLLYSSVKPGQGLTAGEVAQYLLIEKGYDWVTVDFVSWMFKRIGFSKKNYPAAPHQRFASVEEVVQSMSVRQDALMKSSMKVNQIRDQQREIRKLQQEIEEICEAIGIGEDYFKDMLVEHIQVDATAIKGNRIIVQVICDAHSGKHVRSKTDLSRPQNEFNAKILRERVERFCGYVKMVAETVKEKGDVDMVLVLNLGDDLESLFANMRDGQAQDQYSFGFEQYKEAIWLNIQIIKTTLESFTCPVLFVKTGSNHDRALKDKAAKSDEVIAKIALDRLKSEFRDVPNLDTAWGAQVFSVLLPNDVCVIATHGHLKSWNNSNATNVINIHGQGAKRYILLQAHEHHMELYSGYNYKMIKLPAIVGDDDYNLVNLLTGSPPEMLILELTKTQDLIHGPFRLDVENDQ